jgi:hypothetical protein
MDIYTHTPSLTKECALNENVYSEMERNILNVLLNVLEAYVGFALGSENSGLSWSACLGQVVSILPTNGVNL